MRHIRPGELAVMSGGLPRFVPSHRSLDSQAIKDALASASDAELDQIIAATRQECIRWMDTFAARYPDDSRWDDWRAYRKLVTSYGN
jgi:hypothetical protein